MLCLDPGETTGWAVFRNGRLTGWGQFAVVNYSKFEQLLERFQPDRLVVENYRVYPWRQKQHSWSDVPTLRYIGAITVLCELRGIPLDFQMAQLGKGFCTDAKLKKWGLFQVGKRHANDAIRHGCYWLLFHVEK